MEQICTLAGITECKKTLSGPPQHFKNTHCSMTNGYLQPRLIMKWSPPLPLCDSSQRSPVSEIPPLNVFTWTFTYRLPGHCWRKPADLQQCSVFSFLFENNLMSLTFACISNRDRNKCNWTRKDVQHSSHMFIQERRWLKKRFPWGIIVHEAKW